MSGTASRIYLARLAGAAVFDPRGDQVGKVHDIVVGRPPQRSELRTLGMVVEVPVRRRIFLPITRVTSIDAGQVITTGVVNMRRFDRRPGESLVIHEILDKTVTVAETGDTVTVTDVAMEQTRTRDWMVTKVAAHGRGKRFGRRGETRIYDWADLSGFALPDHGGQSAASVIAAFADKRAADLAESIRQLSPTRRREVAVALHDDRLADVIEELDPQEAIGIIRQLETGRAVDVLGAMDPDDATDLLSGLPPDQAEALLALMEPEEADPLRRLLAYEERSAGGMMTSEPVVLAPDATVAEALARIRNADLTPAAAAMVYVCRPPIDTPTGKFLGVGHFQRLLREPPSTLVSAIVDDDLDALPPEATLEQVAEMFAAYDLVACPVVTEGRLVGAVTVDDVVDHMLGDAWRTRDSTGGDDGA